MNTYPSKILPSTAYKLIEGDIKEYHLVRFTSTKDSNKLMDLDTGFLEPRHVCSPRENMIDLSTNLLGIFTLSHLDIELTKEGKEEYMIYCDPDETVTIPIYGTHYLLNSDRGFWVLLIGHIHNTEVKYKISAEDYVATCEVIHTPMKWNYWHFSIRWRLDDGYWNTLDPRGKKKWSRRLANDARSHIRKFAKIEISEYPEIDQNLYLS